MYVYTETWTLQTMEGMFIYTEAWKLRDGIKCPLTNEMGTFKMKNKNVQQTVNRNTKN